MGSRKWEVGYSATRYTADRDGQPYLKETQSRGQSAEYGLLDRVLSRV